MAAKFGNKCKKSCSGDMLIITMRMTMIMMLTTMMKITMKMTITMTMPSIRTVSHDSSASCQPEDEAAEKTQPEALLLNSLSSREIVCYRIHTMF